MRYLFVIVLLAAVSVVPVTAHPVAGFPYDLTLSDGTISGTFGGVPVTGTYTGNGSGTFVLLVDGQVFATGTYTCNGSGCTFSGTQLLGASKSFTLTSAGLGEPASGNLNSLFATHGAWVSGVAKWAQVNLSTLRVGQVVRAAASIEGKSKGQASSGSSAEASREHGGRGKGRGK